MINDFLTEQTVIDHFFVLLKFLRLDSFRFGIGKKTIINQITKIYNNLLGWDNRALKNTSSIGNSWRNV